MRIRIALLGLLIFAVGCTATQIHKVKLANADLSAAIGKLTTTTISLSTQGVITPAEERAILPKLSDATVLSDGIEACTNAPTASSTLVGCVAPLLTSINKDMDPATFGVKSASAQATLSVVLSSATTAVQIIAGVK